MGKEWQYKIETLRKLLELINDYEKKRLNNQMLQEEFFGWRCAVQEIVAIILNLWDEIYRTELEECKKNE